MSQGVIIGGGIAGLSAALFAQQRQLALPIYEKSTKLSCEDNLLWLAPNGLHLLAALGLMRDVQRLAVAQDSMLFSTKRLKTLTALDCRKLQESNGYPIMAIKRADLYQLMLDRFISQGGTITYGLALTDWQTVDRPLQPKLLLAFAGQAKPLPCDYIIAADGIGSGIRQRLFPRSKVHYQGIRTYLGRSKTAVSSRFLGQTIETWGTGTRLMLTSLDGVTTYWSAIERATAYESNGAPIADGMNARLGAAFADYHADIKTVLAHAEQASIHRCNFGVVVGLDHYAEQNICLLGDAAHGMPPNMGQGASLALEDAYCLIAELKRAATPESAFRAYDLQRRPRAKQMMQIANSMNTTFQPKGRFASLVRDAAAASFPQGLSQMRMAQLYKLPFTLSPS